LDQLNSIITFGSEYRDSVLSIWISDLANKLIRLSSSELVALESKEKLWQNMNIELAQKAELSLKNSKK